MPTKKAEITNATSFDVPVLTLDPAPAEWPDPDDYLPDEG